MGFCLESGLTINNVNINQYSSKWTRVRYEKNQNMVRSLSDWKIKSMKDDN